MIATGRTTFLTMVCLIGVIATSIANETRIEEELYANCKDEKRAPWCYEEKVVAMKIPELCEFITQYWGKAAKGVQGYCYYEIAKKTKDCSICNRIKDSRIRNNLCNEDVCRIKSRHVKSKNSKP